MSYGLLELRGWRSPMNEVGLYRRDISMLTVSRAKRA